MASSHLIRMICNKVKSPFQIDMPSIHVKDVVGIYLKKDFYGTFREAINATINEYQSKFKHLLSKYVFWLV